ncbi:MAG: porin [Candidatus Competibacteraceae bacterium]|nr:porin [Candidatus Competibacteraceae bacterium]
MKKSIIALAVASALATPFAAQADTILYGSARVSVDYVDDKGNALYDLLDSDGYFDVVDNSSRLGVLGSEDLGGGLSAIYQYEFGVDVTEGSNLTSNRPKFVGLKGGFGQISLGTQETPYYHVVGIADTFNSGKTFGPGAWLGGGFALDSVGDLGNVRGPGDLVRFDNSLFYATPDFSGFGAEAMVLMQGENSEIFSKSVDFWSLAVKYNNGPFFAGLTYVKVNGDSNIDLGKSDAGANVTTSFDLDQWALGLGYNSGPFGISAIYERGDVNAPGLARQFKSDGLSLTGDEPQNWYLTGSYSFGNNTLRAAYGQLDTGIDGFDKVENYLVGYQYNFSKRTSMWVEYIGRNGDSLFYADQNAVSIGTRVDF